MRIRDDMEILFALLALCDGNLPGFKKSVMRSFGVFCWLEQAANEQLNVRDLRSHDSHVTSMSVIVDIL